MHKDLIKIFSGVFKSIERQCPPDTLPDIVRTLRQPQNKGRDSAKPAFDRWRKRMDFTATLPAMAEAVSRPVEYVYGLLTLFCIGSPKQGISAVCGQLPRCADCSVTRFCAQYTRPRARATPIPRPARRLLDDGADSLSDDELLSVLLHGDKADGQDQCTKDLLAHFGSLPALMDAGPRDYASVGSSTPQTVLRLAAAAALHQRLRALPGRMPLRVTSAREIYNAYAFELRACPQNTSVLLLLDADNRRLRGIRMPPVGSARTMPPIADFLRPAVRENSPRIALAVYHVPDEPSRDAEHPGSAEPSAAHADYCRRLRAAADMLGMRLVDFIIITPVNYYSFAEHARLQ